ncbi:His-Xaa-Ser repeat protein HxsA [Pararhodospirillum oryzae]|uniref:Peptidoglycan binding-like domain-containing protein n=1 Tax=Pararhodospirillum oryzae TaxID=478448 RepID=A0A512H538_9PROT|nr:His-Xaa-Ser repeat protein HxsA [Pararhodospirillum oryzae]GEO80585.1 hypothetical protein ROR02_07160 [Pararhodospirillum oryzae]
MSLTSFLIPTLLAAGFRAPALDPLPPRAEADASPAGRLVERFAPQRDFTLVGHRSHRSHRSHSSHRSSTGGSTWYRSTPRVSPSVPQAAPRVAPSPGLTLPHSSGTASSSQAGAATDGAGVKRIRGNTAAFKALVSKVQLSLYALGYYTDPIDGVLGPRTKDAITRFETSRGLPPTGTVSDRLLDALGISR